MCWSCRENGTRRRRGSSLHLEVKPGDPNVLNNLGNVLGQLGKPMKLKPPTGKPSRQSRVCRCLGNLGNLLREQEAFREALSCYQQAVAAAPDNPLLQNSLGVTLWALGEKSDAIGFFRKALTWTTVTPTRCPISAWGCWTRAIWKRRKLFVENAGAAPQQSPLPQESGRGAGNAEEESSAMSRFALPSPHNRQSVPTGLFIGGTWRDARKKRIAVANPSTKRPITEIA